MSRFNFMQTGIQEITIIEPTIFRDESGYFMETYNDDELFLERYMM